MKPNITVETLVHAPIEKIWDCFTNPEHVKKWYHASDDWHAPFATNDLRIGGQFVTRMEAKDGSTCFNFGGTYTLIEPLKKIGYNISGDARKVTIDFVQEGDGYKVIENFEQENINSEEVQRSGWQEILNNFKKYVESH